MKYNLNVTFFSGQRNVIEKAGDRIWDVICDEIPQRTFTMNDVSKVLMEHLGYARQTAVYYGRAILANVMAETDGEVLERTGNMYRWVESRK